MKIKKLILQNFRCFKDKTEIDVGNLTVFIGQNDIGKSTILEALDVFFNEAKATNPIKSDDASIISKSKEILIGIVFSDFRDDIIVDSSVTTTLKTESLLNADDLLQIHKKFSSGKLKEVTLVANHPANKELKDLLSLKIEDLKSRANELNVPDENYDARISSSIRKAIKDHLGKDIEYQNQEITIFKDKDQGEKNTVKEIWSQIQDYLPVYSLFQSDRKNEEKDSEVQDPMKSAIKQILKNETLREKLSEIKGQVETAAKEVAEKTIEKLKEMNPELAKELIPEFSEPTWDTAFKFTIKSDENIPLDKRGSGVKRLVLINFFRAEAEKRQKERNVPYIIYAVEEPETSQHPDHQRKLINAFIELANISTNQVILTTHSPAIAKLLPPECLVLLKKSGKHVELVKSVPDILNEIASTLGVLPDIELGDISKVRLALCVEGKNDIVFLENLSEMVPELKSIIDIKNDDRIIKLPMGGSTLQFWVNNNYLGKLNLAQIHIYDSDKGHPEKENQYKMWVDRINAKGGKNYACLTEMREFENYVHPLLIKEQYGLELEYSETWAFMDIPEAIAKHNLSNSESMKAWDELDKEDQKDRKGKVKNQLNSEHSKKMSKELLEQINAFSEIEGWFIKCSALIKN